MIYKTPSQEEVNLQLKNTQTARFKRDSLFLVGDYNKSLAKYSDNFLAALADFIYPEKDNEVGCRYKEVFEMFLEGDLSKVDYSLDNDNEKQLRDIAMEILLSFFGTNKSLADKPNS